MSYRSAFVLALVTGLLTTSCSEGNGDGSAPNYCGSVATLAPSCNPTSTPPPTGGSSLTLPSDTVRLKVDGRPEIDFPAEIQLMSLTPAPGTLTVAPFRFTWRLRIRVDNIQQPGGIGVTVNLYPSNDGETPIGDVFGGGYITTPGVDYYLPDGSPGGITMMPVSFKKILVKLKSNLNNGVGEIRATTSFQVDY